MISSLRVWHALALLVGFHLRGVLLPASLVTADAFLPARQLVARSAYLVLSVVSASVFPAVPIVRGMFAFRPAGRRSSGPDGPSVEKAMDAAVDAAVDDVPDTTPLRALLAGSGPATP
jgi:hypothetical protein